MLDEADAPLMTLRRHGWSAKMSAQQFIYITHNKIAMEMAEQMLGVTMQEPLLAAGVGQSDEAVGWLSERIAPIVPNSCRFVVPRFMQQST